MKKLSVLSVIFVLCVLAGMLVAVAQLRNVDVSGRGFPGDVVRFDDPIPGDDENSDDEGADEDCDESGDDESEDGMCEPALVWETEVDLGWQSARVAATLAADDTRLVFLTQEPYMYENAQSPMIGLNAQDGSEVWRDNAVSLVRLSEGNSQERVFATSLETWYYNPYSGDCYQLTENMLHGWDPATGEKVIESTGAEIARSVVQTPRSVLVAGFFYDSHCEPSGYSFSVSLHDNETGDYTWNHSVSYYFASAADVAANRDGSMIFSTGWKYVDQCLAYGYDADTGNVKWEAAIDACGLPLGDQSKIVVSPPGDKIFVKYNGKDAGGTFWMTMVAYDAESGEELWQSQPLSANNTNKDDFVISAGGNVLVITGTETAGISAADGSLLWYIDGTAFVDIATTPTTVVLTGEASDDSSGITMAIRPSTGATVWEMASAGSPAVLAVDARGRRVYVAGPSANGIFVEAFEVPGGDPGGSNL